MQRRSKQERTKALAALFRGAGWSRKGADWEIETNDVRWSAFLSLIRRDEGDWYNVALSANVLPMDPWKPLVYPGLGRLPGASRDVYLGEDSEPVDPLVSDTRRVLLPLVSRLT